MRRTLFAASTLAATLAALLMATAAPGRAADAKAKAKEPIKLLIITGDNVGAHNWKATTPVLQQFLSDGSKFKVDITAMPAKDLTDQNLANYDVLLLNYKDTPQGTPDSKWSDENKKAFLKAVHDDGKGLVVYHFSSAAFANPNWKEFEQAVAGGWRTQGFHGPAHEFKVKKTAVKHPVSTRLPEEFAHVTDELYSASMRTRGSVVLATAYCDPSKPQGTGMDEAVVWVNQYGKGRVFECVLGHDAKALSDPNVEAWIKRGAEWAATGTVED
jgi:type 1 glutamine amidotransferase